MPFRVVDGTPPLRHLCFIGIGDNDTPLSDEPLDEISRLGTPRPGHRSLAVRHGTPPASRRPPSVTIWCSLARLSWARSSTLRRVIGLRRVIRMTAVFKVEVPCLRDPYLDSTASALACHQPAVPQCVYRTPPTRTVPIDGLAGRETTEKCLLPLVQGGPPMHSPSPHRTPPVRNGSYE